LRNSLLALFELMAAVRRNIEAYCCKRLRGRFRRWRARGRAERARHRTRSGLRRCRGSALATPNPSRGRARWAAPHIRRTRRDACGRRPCL